MKSSKAHGRSGHHLGFTLVEILLVIAIIGVLVALLVPSLNRAREQSRRALCASNARGLMTVSLVYSNDYKDNVPDGKYDVVGGSPSPYGTYCFYGPTRRQLFLNYGHSNPRAWWCPSGIARGTVFKQIYLKYDWFTADPSLVGGPSVILVTDDSGVTLGYSNNRDQTGYGYFVGNLRGYTATSATAKTYQLAYVKKFGEAFQPSRRVVWVDPLQAQGVDNCGIGTWSQPANTHDMGGNAISEGGNSAFVDGHVAWRQYIAGVNYYNWMNQGMLYDP